MQEISESEIYKVPTPILAKIQGGLLPTEMKSSQFVIVKEINWESSHKNLTAKVLGENRTEFQIEISEEIFKSIWNSGTISRQSLKVLEITVELKS